MHYVYLLKSLKDDWKYIGYTDNLRTRFDKHQNLEVKSTKAHAPFKLIYYEAYPNKSDARAREYKLKTHSQTKELLYKQLESSLK